MLKKLIFFLALLIGMSGIGNSQILEEDKREYKPNRLKLVVIGGSVFYVGTMVGLYTVWYQDYEQTKFHFFDDNSGWEKVDKFGHAYTSYIMGKGGMKALEWTGIDRKKAIWYGGSFGFLFLSTVEIIDGHYEAWGTSLGDLGANAFGSLLLIGQELAFKKQVVTMKFSYHPTELPKYRPDHLGTQPTEKVIKDYNGQTHWFSVNYRSIFRHHNIIPKWLNIAGGYGAYGMLGGDANPMYHNGVRLPTVDRYQRYYLSLDIDFDKIKTKSKVLNSAFFFLNLLKFPMPTVEFNSKGETIFHPVYF